MITSSDDPNQGRKAQSQAPNLTEHTEPLTGARRRLHRIIAADQLAIIVTNLRLQAGIPQHRIAR